MSRKGSVAVSGCALFHRLHHHYCCCRCPSVASQHSVQLRPFTGGTVGQLTPELSTLPWSVDSWKTENDAWTWCLSVDRAIIVIISIYYITKNYTVTTELNLYHYYYDYYMRGNIYFKKKLSFSTYNVHKSNGGFSHSFISLNYFCFSTFS